MKYSELSDNQLRVSVDIRQTFEAYRQARAHAARFMGGMAWKTVGGQDYLIKIINRRGGTKGLGPRSPETEEIYARFVDGKAQALAREKSLSQSLREFAGMARGVFINRVPNVAVSVLRELDAYGLIGKNLIVIGTHALYAYESVGGVMFDAGLMATTDMDLLWDARSRIKIAFLDDEVAASGVLAVLRKADRTFEPVTTKDGFRAVNKSGFMVDLVKQTPSPPWRIGEPDRIAPGDLKPSWLPNIQWLLSCEKFHSIVIGHDGFPAPMTAPDPRAFATYKLWLADQPDRDPSKRSRDRAQAHAVIDLVRARFPHLPIDDNAERMFPVGLRAFSQDVSGGLPGADEPKKPSSRSPDLG